MSKPQSPTLFMILSFGALLAGAGLSYWQYGGVQELAEKARSARQELGSRPELQTSLQQTTLELQQASTDLTHLEGNLTTVEYVPTLLKDLQRTGESCSLLIEGVRPVPKVDMKAKKGTDRAPTPGERIERKSYEELDVEVRCKGAFNNLMSFMKKLETFPKIVGVRQLNISPQLGQDGKTVKALESTVRIRVYVFPKTAMPSAVTQAQPAQPTPPGNPTAAGPAAPLTGHIGVAN